MRVEDKANGDMDIISGIEKGEFSDGTIGQSFTQADPKLLQGVALMYQVVLDRAADADGLAFWPGSRDSSMHIAWQTCAPGHLYFFTKRSANLSSGLPSILKNGCSRGSAATCR